MWRRVLLRPAPIPEEFLEWQVVLRAHTMRERHGTPHVGVAPLLTVETPGVGTGDSAHSIIVGLLPRADRLEAATDEFRALYERNAERGARALYDAGLRYFENYYQDAKDFDPTSITSLLPRDLPLVRALRAQPRCSLLFYVFDLEERGRIGRLRCTQLHGRAELLEKGPVFDNVWWHNTIFHGPAEEHLALRFRHSVSYDTGFGKLDKR